MPLPLGADACSRCDASVIWRLNGNANHLAMGHGVGVSKESCSRTTVSLVTFVPYRIIKLSWDSRPPRCNIKDD